MKKMFSGVIVAGLSGLLLAVGFASNGGVMVSSLGLYVLFWSLLFRKELPKYFLFYSYLFGLCFFGLVMSWIFDTETTKLIHDSFFAGFFKFLTLFLFVSVMATGFVVSGVLLKKIYKQTFQSGWLLLLIPSIWVIGEYTRSVLFSIFSYGPGGSVGPYWNFGTLGLLLTETPLKYAGRFIGLYGLSFMAVFIVIAIVFGIKRKPTYLILLTTPLIISFFGWVVYKNTNGTEVKVGITNFGSDLTDIDQQILSKKINKNRPDVVVLPEYANYFYDAETGEKREIRKTEKRTLFIDSATIPTSSGPGYNAVHYYDQNGNVLNKEKKSFLVPGVEYVPYVYSAILGFSGNDLIVQDFQENRSVEKSDVKEQPYKWLGVSYGALACSGAIAPNEYSNLVNQGANVLVNNASMAAIGVSEGYYSQAASMAKFIAVANARPFVQSAKGGESFVLKTDGSRKESIKANRANFEYSAVNLKTNKTRTVYSLLGEWAVLVSAFTLVVAFMKLKPKRVDKKLHTGQQK